MHYTKIECQLKIDKRQSLKLGMLKHYRYTYVATVYIQYTYTVDVLWCQPIKLIQVVSTSEFHEY